jgi:hypothetical protein
MQEQERTFTEQIEECIKHYRRGLYSRDDLEWAIADIFADLHRDEQRSE